MLLITYDPLWQWKPTDAETAALQKWIEETMREIHLQELLFGHLLSDEEIRMHVNWSFKLPT
jgi:hypothetical protein